MIININEDFRFRPWQVELYHKLLAAKYSIVTVTRQHGKSKFFMMLALDFLFMYNKRPNPKAMVVLQSIKRANSIYFSELSSILSEVPQSVCVRRGGSSQTEGYISFFRPQFGDWATIVFTGASDKKSVAGDRGETMDLVILDETSLFPPGSVQSVYMPMVDDTDGKVVMTGTIDEDNWFWDLCLEFKRKQACGDKDFAYYKGDVYSCGWRGAAFIKRVRDMYLATRELGQKAWDNEYLMLPSTPPGDVAPFMRKVNHIMAHKDTYSSRDPLGDFSGDSLNGLRLSSNRITNIACDLGKPQNYRSWAWENIEGRPTIVDYGDSHAGQDGFVMDCVRKWSKKSSLIVLWFPDDIQHPFQEGSKTRLDRVIAFINEMGYSRSVQVRSLGKVSKKDIFIQDGAEFLDKFAFDFDNENVLNGLDRLRKCKLKVSDSTGEVNRKVFVAKGGHGHSADAYLYMYSAVSASLKSFYHSGPGFGSANRLVSDQKNVGIKFKSVKPFSKFDKSKYSW